MQAFSEGQLECLLRRGKLVLFASQPFGTGVHFYRNLLPSILTHSQLDSGHQSTPNGSKKSNIVDQKELLCPADCVKYIVLLKVQVITIQMRALSHERYPVEYFNVLNF